MTDTHASFALPDESGSLTIREATLADVECLVQMNAAMAWETERRRLDLTRLRAGTRAVLESRDRGFYLLAVIQSPSTSHLPVGQLLITTEWSDWRNGAFWWIQSVYVDPRWRGRGIFRRLFHCIEDMAHNHPDVCGLRLYVEHHNLRAQAVYTKLGLSRTAYLMFEKDFVLSSDTSQPLPPEGTG